jgi:phosphoglycolate phosphatase
MNNLLKRRNMKPITIDEYRNVFTFPVKKYYKKLGHDVSEKKWKIISHEFINEYESRKSECSLYPFSIEVLNKIKQLNINQSILSAYSQHTLEEIVEQFNIHEYFIRVVGLDNIYAGGKIENGKKWMSELNHSKGEVLLIGDTLHDLEVAKEISADCILLSCGHQSEDILRKSAALIFKSLLDFYNNITS